MAPPPSHLQSLLPCDSCLKLKRVDDGDGRVSIVATVKSGTAQCPRCHRSSSRVHSRYSRALRDLPWHGSAVELRVEVRRFRCRTRDCPRRTFVERLPTVMARYARQTARLAETIRLMGYMLGGEPGARLAVRLGMETSPDTVLRRIKLGSLMAPATSPEVLGVDDWAWRKGQRYGTILVDLERRMPIDLLPDRSAESLESWLKAHPGVKLISRDRAGAYAQGATNGAPEAVQVADRFHLLCNLTSAVERSLEPRRALLRSITSEVSNPARATPPVPRPPLPKSRSQQQKEERRARRLERYNQVVELHQRGMSQSEISRQLHLERKTVRRLLRAGKFPERCAPHRRPAQVNAFREYLQQRWNEGCHNATQLWREIQSRGYSGGRCMVAKLVSEYRTSGTQYFRQRTVQPEVKHRDLSPRQAAILMARRHEDLSTDQQRTLAQLTEVSPEIATMRDLVGEFRAMLRGRNEEDLPQWTSHAIASGLPEMKRFGETLLRDQSAIRAAIRLSWSNGQVEGQVHRLKLIKRQMYGRAGFLLLKGRVLPLWSSGAPMSGGSP